MLLSSIKKQCFFTALLLGFGTGFTQAQTVSKYIVTDQFGYLPGSKKIAVIRDPQTGFDAAESFTPGTTYALVNKATLAQVVTGSPTTWKSGAEDAASGDKAWWFDFTSVSTPGTYYVLDITNNVRSYEFDISEDVYKEVLKHAVRTFFYQRAGFEKSAQYAGAEWADGASHTKPLQDKNARVYNNKTSVATEKDVSGGWYDAGDYNKYTSWTANYVVDFMRAYLENPGAWGDDYNIPESGNHIPDLLDEAKWGIDHLLRMQNKDGSVLSIVGLSHASPPSSATGPSYYGTASTSATLNTAGAFALASKVYGSRGMKAYSDTLKARAIKAWAWAEANPTVLFKNNDAASGTTDLGAGQQETDDYGRAMAKLEAACFLYEITGEAKYRTFFDTKYQQSNLKIYNSFAYAFETSNQEILLHYTTLPGATASVVSDIKAMYKTAMINGSENFVAYYDAKDPYLAHIPDYTWGTNSTKNAQGLMFTDMMYYQIDAAKDADAKAAAEGYIHYMHGVNPLSMVYLSNMYKYGAENGVNEFYHTWFSNGSAKWDRVGTSTYGPAPGFVTGGPNPSYDWDGCCPGNCGGSNSVCNSETLTPPKGQPKQKSYKDFNTSWPLNSWSVTENSDGYQLNYIRLLSKFVKANYDCSGTKNGTASYDVCNWCSGGTTGLTPVTDPTKCVAKPVVTGVKANESTLTISPNPSEGIIYIQNTYPGKYQVKVLNSLGKEIASQSATGNTTLNIGNQPSGMYQVIIKQANQSKVVKMIKL